MSNNLTAVGQSATTKAFAIITLMLAILIVLVAIWFGPEEIPFLDFSTEFVVQLITAAFLVALFIERTTEVFHNAWRGGEGANIARELIEVKQKHKAANMNDTEIAGQSNVQKLQAKRAIYRSENKRLALLSGLILGIIISALGVRLIMPFLEPRVIDELSSGHHRLLIGVDVLVTGALLGGGANGLHKVLDLFLKHVDAKREKLRNLNT